MEKPPPTHQMRVILTDEDKKNLTVAELLEKWKAQEEYIKFIESQSGSDPNGIDNKLKLQQQEATRRENVLLMRLSTKEQEMQDLLGQVQELKQTQAPSTSQLQAMLIDPAVNLLFEKMKTELTETKDRLEQAQNDLSAWKFTPDSVTGKKLMAKCRMLIQENQELGKQLSHGRIAQLESELALQRKYSEELKGSQDEMNEFVIQLDEEVEGMQATICALQEQLKAAKAQSDTYEQENIKLKKLHEMHATTLTTTMSNNTSNGDHIQQMDQQPPTTVQQMNEPTSGHIQESNEQKASVQIPLMNDEQSTVQLQNSQEHYVEIKEEYLDERTIHPSSNGDSNMSNTSDELPMETEPSITLTQKEHNLRTEDFTSNLETTHHLPVNHVKVICGDDNNSKDVETTQLHSFVSPTKGLPKTSFTINNLLSSSRTDCMKKGSSDITMDGMVGAVRPMDVNGETQQQHVVASVNGQIDDSVV